jgi:hypothetical protein
LYGRCDTSDFDGDGSISQSEKDYAYVYGWYLLRCRVGGYFSEEFCKTILPVSLATVLPQVEALVPVCLGGDEGESYLYPGADYKDNGKEFDYRDCRGESINSFTIVKINAQVPMREDLFYALVDQVCAKFGLVAGRSIARKDDYVYSRCTTQSG